MGSTVTFAIDLADEIASFQDYVIAHELLHLRVRYHGRGFQSLDEHLRAKMAYLRTRSPQTS
jgi:predicted metal-dependent hydrolase